MTCGKLEERLAAYADGEQDAEVEAHVAGCKVCAAEVDALRQTLRAARSGAGGPVRDEKFWTDFTRDVRVAYYEEDQKRRRRWWIGACAVGFAATVALFAIVLPARLGPRKSAPAPEVAATEPKPFTLPVENEEDLEAHELDAVLGALDEVEAAVLAEAADDVDDDLVPEAEPEATVEDLEGEELERVLDALSKGV